VSPSQEPATILPFYGLVLEYRYSALQAASVGSYSKRGPYSRRGDTRGLWYWYRTGLGRCYILLQGLDRLELELGVKWLPSVPSAMVSNLMFVPAADFHIIMVKLTSIRSNCHIYKSRTLVQHAFPQLGFASPDRLEILKRGSGEPPKCSSFELGLASMIPVTRDCTV